MACVAILIFCLTILDNTACKFWFWEAQKGNDARVVIIYCFVNLPILVIPRRMLLCAFGYSSSNTYLP